VPTFDILRHSVPSESWRAAKVRSQYDIRGKRIEERFVGELPLPQEWQIGVITGRSGTGKTTLARELWPEAYVTSYQWQAASVIDDFETTDDVGLFKMLHRVGFGSIPSWLKPYSVLSQGEQMRINLARALLDERLLIVFDEFTSTVDRTVAQFACRAVRKAIEATGKQMIVVSCHDDFIPWLQPDWVFSTDDMEMKKKTTRGQSCSWTSTKQAQRCGPCFASITI